MREGERRRRGGGGDTFDPEGGLVNDIRSIFSGSSGPSKQAIIRSRTLEHQVRHQEKQLAQAERRFSRKGGPGARRAVGRQRRLVDQFRDLLSAASSIGLPSTARVGTVLKQLPGRPTVQQIRTGRVVPTVITAASVQTVSAAPQTAPATGVPSTLPPRPGVPPPPTPQNIQDQLLLLILRAIIARQQRPPRVRPPRIRTGGRQVGFGQFLGDVGGALGGALGNPNVQNALVRAFVPPAPQQAGFLPPAVVAGGAAAAGLGALLGGNGVDVEGEANVGDLTRALGLSGGAQLFKSTPSRVVPKRMIQEMVDGKVHTWLYATPYRWKVRGTLVGGRHSHRHSHRRPR